MPVMARALLKLHCSVGSKRMENLAFRSFIHWSTVKVLGHIQPSTGPTQGRSSLTWMLPSAVSSSLRTCRPSAGSNQPEPLIPAPASSIAAHCCPLKPSLRPTYLDLDGNKQLNVSRFPSLSSANKQPKGNRLVHIPSHYTTTTRRTRTLAVFYSQYPDINKHPSLNIKQKPPPRSSPPSHFFFYQHHQDARPRHRDRRVGLPRR